MRVEGFIANNPQLCWVCGRSDTSIDLFISPAEKREAFRNKGMFLEQNLNVSPLISAAFSRIVPQLRTRHLGHTASS